MSAAGSPLTPTLSPEYGGEGVGTISLPGAASMHEPEHPLSRSRERVGVRVCKRARF